ncbi:MAG: hypothetical protein IPP13_02655 [Kouleothrix sp.]|jgi:5-methylcytosine-specific restriction protein A|nr:hypothetical protein [Kouleothrix sp.]
MEAIFKTSTVTTQDILTALSHFNAEYADTNAYDSWLEKASYKFAIKYDGKLYPCKYILSQATGIDTSEFSGGNQTNSVFRRLGFQVIEKPNTRSREP